MSRVECREGLYLVGVILTAPVQCTDLPDEPMPFQWLAIEASDAERICRIPELSGRGLHLTVTAHIIHRNPEPYVSGFVHVPRQFLRRSQRRGYHYRVIRSSENHVRWRLERMRTRKQRALSELRYALHY